MKDEEVVLHVEQRGASTKARDPEVVARAAERLGPGRVFNLTLAEDLSALDKARILLRLTITAILAQKPRREGFTAWLVLRFALWLL